MIEEYILKYFDSNNLNKNLFQQFLNHILSHTSAHNRNNYRTDIGGLLQLLSDYEIIKQNSIENNADGHLRIRIRFKSMGS